MDFFIISFYLSSLIPHHAQPYYWKLFYFHEERAYNVLDVLTPMAKQKAVSVAQLALGWLLHQPVVSSVIIGATKLQQLEDNLKSVEVTFTTEEMKQLNEVSKIPSEYPGGVLEVMTMDRSAGVDFLKA